jgi:hypothetical protein
MLWHIFSKVRQQKTAFSTEPAADRRDSPPMQQTIEADIDKLFVCSRKGLWALVIFFAVSIVAYQLRDQTLTGCLSTAVREQLGPAPPDILIDILQLVSTFSSLILICGKIYDIRTAGDTWKPGNTWAHLGFRLVFFPLYFIADSLGAHFDFVFVSGIVVLGLQHYCIWNYSSRVIEEKLTLWDHLSACERGAAGK